jgi:hypothetical protein
MTAIRSADWLSGAVPPGSSSISPRPGLPRVTDGSRADARSRETCRPQAPRAVRRAAARDFADVYVLARSSVVLTTGTYMTLANGIAGRCPSPTAGRAQAGLPASIQRWKVSTWEAGHAPSQGIFPFRSSPTMASA